MEAPTGWSRLIASIALGGADDLDFTWRFLVAQQLVTDTVQARSAFEQAYREEMAISITGPSVEARAAFRISSFALPSAQETDSCAQKSSEAMRDWLGSSGLDERPHLRERIARFRQAHEFWSARHNSV